MNRKQLRVEITLPIDPPHPFTNAGNLETFATKVWWERTITEDGDHITYVTVFAEDGRNRSYYPPFDKAPDWVPRPTASWHAIVSELAAEVLA